MRNLSLTLSRLCLAGWIGAASLFVVSSVLEQVSPRFDSGTKGELALVRFPAYYVFGFALMGTALAAACGGLDSARYGRRRRWVCCGLIAAALVVAVVDYVWVYRPLASMLSMPIAARPAEFVAYHEWSKNLNFAHLGIAFVAACMICWPVRRAE